MSDAPEGGRAFGNRAFAPAPLACHRVWREEEELQERCREIRARVISGQVMHHSADPSAEAVRHQQGDRCDYGTRALEQCRRASRRRG